MPPINQYTANDRLRWEQYADQFRAFLDGRAPYPGEPPAGYVDVFRISQPYAPVPADYPAAVQNAMRTRATEPAPALDPVTNKRDAVGMSEGAFAQFLSSQKDFVTTILDRAKINNAPWRKPHAVKSKNWKPKTETQYSSDTERLDGVQKKRNKNAKSKRTRRSKDNGDAEGGATTSESNANVDIVIENADAVHADGTNEVYQADEGPVIAVDEGDTDPWQPDEDDQMQG